MEDSIVEASGEIQGDAPRYSAVIFDLFITLTDYDAERRRPAMIRQLAHALSVDADGFATLMQETFTERSSGHLGDLSATLIALCRRLGVEPTQEQLDTAVALRLSQVVELTQPRTGVLDVLAALKAQGYLVGVISDCTCELPELWHSLSYPTFVDAVAFSCELGFRKPHPSLYHHVLEALHVEPHRCLYVGDGSSSELSGAAAVGMTAVLLDTPFSEEFRFDAETGWTGEVIADLAEVLHILDSA